MNIEQGIVATDLQSGLELLGEIERIATAVGDTLTLSLVNVDVSAIGVPLWRPKGPD